MSDQNLTTIPARRGVAARVRRGQAVRVVNTHGDQVVDTWAFNAEDMAEHLSMEHTRPGILKVIPAVGDALLTNKRRPILTLVEDSSGGVHDMLMAACDRWRYEGLGCTEYHDNCTDNLHAALQALGCDVPDTPSPLNLFMNIPVHPGGALSFDAPRSVRGGAVVLRAEMDLVIAFSACPQDILPINGVGHAPTEAHFGVG